MHKLEDEQVELLKILTAASDRSREIPSLSSLTRYSNGWQIHNRGQFGQNRIDSRRATLREKKEEEMQLFLKQLQEDAEQVRNLNGTALQKFMLQGAVQIPRGTFFYSIPGPALKELMIPAQQQNALVPRTSKSLSAQQLFQLLRTHSRFEANPGNAPKPNLLTPKTVYDLFLRQHPKVNAVVQAASKLSSFFS